MIDLVEIVAFAMWKAEADRAAPNVGKHRTLEGFASASPAERDRWLGLAEVAVMHALSAAAEMVDQRHRGSLPKHLKSEDGNAIRALIGKGERT